VGQNVVKFCSKTFFSKDLMKVFKNGEFETRYSILFCEVKILQRIIKKKKKFLSGFIHSLHTLTSSLIPIVQGYGICAVYSLWALLKFALKMNTLISLLELGASCTLHFHILYTYASVSMKSKIERKKTGPNGMPESLC
jgi:hypothetical protein